jgi:integrase
MARKSTSSPAAKPAKLKPFRPNKPYPDFPLGATSTGYWQKRIGGKLHYFGKWAKRDELGQLVRLPNDGAPEALRLYNEHVNGKPDATGGLTVRDLCNHFLTSKDNLLKSKELAQRTFEEYEQIAKILVAEFGRDRQVTDLKTIDFETLRAKLAQRWGPVRLGNAVQRVKTVFKYGYDTELIDKLPRALGRDGQFRKPSKKKLREHRNESGEKVFTADEIRRMLDAASVPMRAMILLGINAAYGNSDCGELPRRALDLDGGWVTFPRPKTGVKRRASLWPETVAALQAAIAERPEPRDKAHAGLVFITMHGRPWAADGYAQSVTQETCSILKRLHINGRRNLGFYGLRHTFRVVADATRDQVAARYIMGHTDESIDGVYRDASQIDDSRLRTVAEAVHDWLFAPAEGGGR